MNLWIYGSIYDMSLYRISRTSKSVSQSVYIRDQGLGLCKSVSQSVYIRDQGLGLCKSVSQSVSLYRRSGTIN